MRSWAEIQASRAQRLAVDTVAGPVALKAELLQRLFQIAWLEPAFDVDVAAHQAEFLGLLGLDPILLDQEWIDDRCVAVSQRLVREVVAKYRCRRARFGPYLHQGITVRFVG